MATKNTKLKQTDLDEAVSPELGADEAKSASPADRADESIASNPEPRVRKTRAPSTQSAIPLLAPGDAIEPAAPDADGTPALIVEPHPLDEETLLPVHGMVRLSEREMHVIDHPAFQRTFDIHQLGQTHFVYRGATHMRGQHAIGSLHVIALMAEALERNACRGELRLSAEWQPGAPLSGTELAFVRLGALLHDIGHLAAGHTLEDELGLLPPHDANQRLRMVLEHTDWHGRQYDTLRDRIDRRYADDARLAAQPDPASTVGAHLSATEIFLRVVSKDYDGEQGAPGVGFRLGVARDLVGNTICADLLDYLHRDWWHLGKPRHFDPRLLDYLEIRSRRHPSTDREEHALVINLRGGTRPRPDAVTSIMDLLESRYQLSEIALFHRTKVIAAAMLERVIAEYQDTFASETERQEDIHAVTEQLLECSDVEMLSLWRRRLAARRAQHPKRVDAAIDLSCRLRVRALHRELGSYYDDDLLGSGETVRATFSGDPRLQADEQTRDRRRAAANRLAAVRLIEADFNLPVGSIVMYCPSLKMNLKIARVKVLANNIVDPLADIEDRDERITGGHLRAQKTRFRRLWRVTFGIDRDVFAKIDGTEIEALLIETIETAVLQIKPRGSDPTTIIRSVAEKLTQMPDAPWTGHSLLPLETGRERASLYYPGPGQVPSPRAFIGD